MPLWGLLPGSDTFGTSSSRRWPLCAVRAFNVQYDHTHWRRVATILHGSGSGVASGRQTLPQAPAVTTEDTRLDSPGDVVQTRVMSTRTAGTHLDQGGRGPLTYRQCLSVGALP
jgi:hypothetical protein